MSRGVLAVTAAGLALSIAGCGYVKRDARKNRQVIEDAQVSDSAAPASVSVVT
ncbi:MAG: hypothetical protein ABI024_09300 [Vicinamibacterales bacterium]